MTQEEVSLGDANQLVKRLCMLYMYIVHVILDHCLHCIFVVTGYNGGMFLIIISRRCLQGCSRAGGHFCRLEEDTTALLDYGEYGLVNPLTQYACTCTLVVEVH